MAKNLVIVESPTKARTIERFLGRNYAVRACLGHVRDLPKSKLGLDVEHDFRPQYVVPKEKREILKGLKDQARAAGTVYLATDPDREGEAIAWHLAEAMDLSDRQVRRVEFHEVTSAAVLAAVQNPRQIDRQRVDAQQARRVLDRLVGYELSPLLWKKVRRGLSAGRVQSVAVRLVVEREREIEAFQAVEYWTIDADLAKQGKRAKPEHFLAGLVARRGEKVELHNQAEADAVVAALEGAAYRVASIREREQQRNPAAPFTTSTLQQEASRKLSFTAKRTMMVAQQLYEGIDLGGEAVGLITYMRTDSTQVAESAQAEARDFIRDRYGEASVPPQTRVYRTRSRLAQEAHEAIRPTSVYREPAAIKARLTPEQFRLYELIWKRFVASQMASARFDVTTVEVEATPPRNPADKFLFRATGSRLKFAGFLAVYAEGRDDATITDEERKPLPPLAQGEELDLLALLPEQHFTEPPPRYSEATLVKALEERGIGRPSTYAPTLATIQERGYVERVEKRLRPTELGMLVNDLLVEHFGDVVDVDFTANMEEELDEVAQGRRPWVPIVREFYEPFHRKLEVAEQTVGRVKPPDEPTEEICEKCGRNMVIKLGRFGRFLACPGFPECRNAKSLQVKIGVACPACGADLVEKRTKSKRTFYGCATYPACEWTSWQKPVAERCPTCGGIQVEAARDRLRCLTCNPLPERPASAARGRQNGAAAASRNGTAAKAGAARATGARRTTAKAPSRNGHASGTTSGARAKTGASRTTRGRATAATKAKPRGRATTRTAAARGGKR
ncbi:MAG TPA: type I DNA topoisomerase [Chloroflexota bacterium]|nr:type I DNA topoisomerase [Chloroflexota bacterium]